jgi:pullulanase/glycogen debranching enzyme
MTTAPGRVTWGYDNKLFAPERYASRQGEEVIELKRLIQAFHDRGIAVFMDVVYNHTAEGSWVQDGRLADKCYNLCDDIPEIYRGTANKFFANASGTGNDVDFAGGDRFTKRLVRDSLTLWHTAYSVDGFRFALARILADGSTDAADWIDGDPRFVRAICMPNRGTWKGSGGTSWTAALGLAKQPLGDGSASTVMEHGSSQERSACPGI